MLCTVIDHFFIDLIGHDKEIVLDRQVGQLPQALLAIHRTGGIVGGADDDGLGARGDSRPDGI